jgi:hypothetical protein
MSDVKYRIPNDTVAGARKAGNDMKKNAGLPKMGDSPASWQTRDKDLGFNGQDNGSSQRATRSSIQVNQHTGHMNDGRDVQFTQMPNRKGNISDADGRRRAPATAGNPMSGFRNPDMINMGAGPRNAGSTRSWDPKAGQNYKGNPDKIQDRQLYNNRGNKD